MIGRLSGKLLQKDPPQLLLDVNGVGYELEAPMSTFYQLPEIGDNLVLHTHLVVREDAQLLYAFASLSERKLFRCLIKVNGVGAKLALGLLSGMSADEFSTCIQDKNTTALVRLPGVGKKTAERLIVELTGKLDEWGVGAAVGVDGEILSASVKDSSQEAISALLSLGYKQQEATRLVQQVDTQDMSCELIIKAALKLAVSN